jgi:hypothetical protein
MNSPYSGTLSDRELAILSNRQRVEKLLSLKMDLWLLDLMGVEYQLELSHFDLALLGTIYLMQRNPGNERLPENVKRDPRAIVRDGGAF